MTSTVIVTCTPTLKPFMDRATSGLMAASLGQREGTYGMSGSFAMQPISKRSVLKPHGSMRHAETTEDYHHLTPATGENRSTVLTSMRGSFTGNPRHIEKSVEVDVRYSDEAHLNPVRQSTEDFRDDLSTDAARQ